MRKSIVVILLAVFLFVFVFSLMGCACASEGTCDACGSLGQRHVYYIHGRTFHICADCRRRAMAGEDIGL